jgi:isochorismate hydrolase
MFTSIFSAMLHKGLVVDPRDILLEKPRCGAFHGTDLELILRSPSIDTITVTGIATNVCCETTAREGVVRDFGVLFLSDGIATFDIGDVSAAELQKATCVTLGLLFAQVLRDDQQNLQRDSMPSGHGRKLGESITSNLLPRACFSRDLGKVDSKDC